MLFFVFLVFCFVVAFSSLSLLLFVNLYLLVCLYCPSCYSQLQTQCRKRNLMIQESEGTNQKLESEYYQYIFNINLFPSRNEILIFSHTK